MAVRYEVVASIREEGREKPRYIRVGSIIETRNGDMLKMDSIPLGWNGWAYLNEPKPKAAPDANPDRGRPSDPAPANTGVGIEDDDIPF